MKLEGAGHFIFLLLVCSQRSGRTSPLPSVRKLLPQFLLSFGDISGQSFKEWHSLENFKQFLGEDVGAVVAAGGEEMVRHFLELSRVVLLLEHPRSFLLKTSLQIHACPCLVRDEAIGLLGVSDRSRTLDYFR